MALPIKEGFLPAVSPTDADLYPETDGKPMAVSDLHRLILTRSLDAFDEHFKNRPEVYVSGDILMYYVEGDPRQVISPDVLITFGIGKKLRRTYKVWEEGKVPDFVMEFSSKNTYRNDLGRKAELYAILGIANYFLYDAEGLYLPSPLMGFNLIDSLYVPVSPGIDGGLHSSVLGLDFHVGDLGLGIYDPAAGDWVQTAAESAMARAEMEAIARQQETARAEMEAIARQQETARAAAAEVRAETAEAEIKRLREQLARLQAQH